jgi:phage-related protein
VKPVIWLGSALEDVRSFSAEARREVGYQLYKVQVGLEPSDWKSVTAVGSGVQEIRVYTGKEYRVLYVTKFGEAIYVLHAFVKKTGKTTIADLALARQRFRVLMKERNHS